MSRFTTLGWIALPFVIALRAPFAIVTFVLIYLSKALDKVARLSIAGMNAMPTVKYREDWVKADYDRRVKERLDGLRVGSQKA
jgi:hypothetical protein